MNAEDYCGLHLVFYFLIMAIGGIYIRMGYLHPVYNTETGEIIKPYSLFFVVFGAVLIVLAFIGLVFFSEDKESTKDEKRSDV